MLKDKAISEDAERDGLDEVQKLTNNYIVRIANSPNQRARNHERVCSFPNPASDGPRFG